jgi:hypothetical protein
MTLAAGGGDPGGRSSSHAHQAAAAARDATRDATRDAAARRTNSNAGPCDRRPMSIQLGGVQMPEGP